MSFWQLIFNQEQLLYCTVPSPSTALVFAEYLKTYHTEQCSEINPALFLVTVVPRSYATPS